MLGLLLLAPVGAEYLNGYDTSTGNPAELLGNLVIFSPLYGGAALIIREVAVRTRIGWPGRLCWAAAFGIVEAGLIDQGLFNRSYRDIPYWEQLVGPTWVPALGLSLGAGLLFVVGHLVWSITGPTLLVESIHPRLRHRPWLSPVGLTVAILGYGLASYFVLDWHLQTEGVVTGAAQLVGAGVLALALVGLGVGLGRRPRTPLDAPTPSPGLLAAGAAVATVLFELDQRPIGTALAIAVLVLALALVARFSRTPGWSARHALLVVGGLLLARAASGFLVDPIGDVPPAAQYAHNTVAVLLVLGLVALARVRLGTDRSRVRGTVSVASSTMNASTEESTHGPGQPDRRGRAAHRVGVPGSGPAGRSGPGASTPGSG